MTSEKRKTYWPRVRESYLISKSVVCWLNSKLRRRRKRTGGGSMFWEQTRTRCNPNGLALYFGISNMLTQMQAQWITSSGWLLLQLSSTVLLIKIHSDRLVINTCVC